MTSAARATGVFIFLSCSVIAFAQPPLIYNRAVYNAASYMPAGLPNGAIAQGSIFSFFGSNMGPTPAVTASSFPLGATLGGVSVNIVQGQKVVSAIPLYVSATQINAIMPSNAPLGLASVQVVVGNLRSNLSPVRITGSAFGIFSALGSGLGEGILQNYISADNQPINAPTVTAQPGQAITLWGTGLGPVSFADTVPPTPGNLSVKTEVFVGGVSAPILYNGRAPCCAGTDQVVFTVPNNAPSGCWVPVYVRTGGTTVSNFVTMAIGPQGQTCTTDVLPQVTSSFINGAKLTEALFTRTTTRQDIGVLKPVEVASDFYVAFAFQPNVVQFPFNPALAFPPGGTCTAYTEYGDMINGLGLPGMAPTTMPLDFGPPFQLTGPRGSKTMSQTYLLAQAGSFGGSIGNGVLPSSLFLDPGSYTLQGFGGADIGKFTTNFNIPTPPTWTNRDQLVAVNRSQPLQISWTGGDSGQRVTIIGIGEDLPTNSSATFVCMAQPGATSITIPPDLLSNMPPSRLNVLQSKDIIYMVTLSGTSVQPLAATGIDQGLTGFYSIVGKTVFFQ
jgi:uncharacterized protein (TIGR03437 family)